MFTSRAEFRLQLRIDNADRRLTPHGRRVGLINDAAWQDFQAKQNRLEAMKQLLEKTKLTAGMAAKLGSTLTHAETAAPGRPNARVGADALVCPAEQSSAEVTDQRSTTDDYSSTVGQSLAQLLKRPEVLIEHLAEILREALPAFFKREDYSVPSATVGSLPSEIRNELKSVETEIKYAGYLNQQQRSIDRLKKAEQRAIPDWFDYRSVSGLSREMQEKLLKIRPRTLGHASRIPGVTPAAVSLVNVYIEIQGRRREQAAAL
jgi:tRNA uridine 5-carboxymethylaminomethyl modification enzyme